ncbi:MAG: hypothetical protein IT530_16640 [Burkholderiales bacterium]|nr:hypothetical protein [Burkholderiales bacterium]
MSRHWLDDARNVKRLWRGFLALLVMLVIAELVVEPHPHFQPDALFGFHAWYGFLACAVMIAIAKLLGSVLKRSDTYYDRTP